MDQLISIECSDVMKDAKVEKILIFYFIFCNIWPFLLVLFVMTKDFLNPETEEEI